MMKKYLPVLAIVSLASALVFALPATVQPGGSIQSAVNAASAGETIIVKTGNYPESVTITPTAKSGARFVGRQPRGLLTHCL